MNWSGLAIFSWQVNQLLAQAGVPSGQDDRNEGWGGMIGIGVILLAVWLTMIVIRRFGRGQGEDEALQGEESTTKDEKFAAGRGSSGGRGGSVDNTDRARSVVSHR